jgi:hypothetical protein
MSSALPHMNSSPGPFSWKEKGSRLRFPLSLQERGLGGEFAQRNPRFTGAWR